MEKLVELRSHGDEDMTKSKGKDPLEGLGGHMTRARARKAKQALQQMLSILFEYKPKFQGEKFKVVSCIMSQMEEDFHFVSILKCLVCLNNGPTFLPLRERMIRRPTWSGR